jgi:hypothetical protein
MRIIQTDLDAALAPLRAKAQATGQPVSGVVLGHKVRVIPATDSSGMTMDQRKRAFRQIG